MTRPVPVLTAAHVDQSGQAIVLIAILLTAMLMTVGLAVDTGRLFVARRVAQEAADAAAFGGGVVLFQGGTVADAVAAARADATTNGFTHNVGGNTVVVNSPPTSGVYLNNSQHLEVIITQTIPTVILPQSLGVTTITVRGVGGSQPVGNTYALMALDQNPTSGALSVGTGAIISLQHAGLAVDSTSIAAATNGGGTVSFVGPPAVLYTDVVGNVTGTFPNVRPNQAVIPDPYGGFPKPSTAGLPTIATVTCCALVPGVYTVDVSGAGPWVMAPGVYIFKGKSLKVDSMSGSVGISNTGTGVLIYLAPTDYPAATGGCGQLQLEGNGVSANITAQMTATGPVPAAFKGMLVYVDPNCSGFNVEFANGPTTTILTGTIYAPSATIEIHAGTMTTTQLIGKKIQLDSGANLTVNFSAGSTATPLVPALAE